MERKTPLLVSACLLGNRCRYDGGHRKLDDAVLERLREKFQLISICPEEAGGLPTPRPASEIQKGDGHDVLNKKAVVRNAQGKDVTEFFVRGAQKTLELARRTGCTAALLKARSPSCGVGQIYNGSFSGHLRAGNGTAAALLQQHGIRLFTEEHLSALFRTLASKQPSNHRGGQHEYEGEN